MPVPFTVPVEFVNGTSIVAADHNSNWDAIESYVELLSAGTNLDSGSVTTAKIADANVTTAKITDGNVTLVKLAAAVQNLLVPAGTIVATVKSTADTGWLLLNGATITNAQSLYTALWDAVPLSWKSGSSIVLPNTANKLLGGVGTITLGALGGDNTILETNLPSHAHTLSAHTHGINPPNTSVTISDPGHGHVSGVVIRGSAGAFGGAASGHGGAASVDPADANIVANTTGITASVDIAAFTSDGPNTPNTSSVGGGTDLRVEQLSVNFQIKAH